MHSETPFALAKHGVALREAGATDEAAAIFTRLMQEFPQLAYGWQEMGVLQARHGHDTAALALFERAAALVPADTQAARYLVLHRLRLGQPEAARAALHNHADASPGADISALLSQADFTEAFPAETALALAEKFEAGPGYLETEAVAARILAAIAAGTPLCLIRLGDGEGAWLDLGPEDRARFAPLYAANRRQTLRTWFGSTALEDSAAFAAAMRRAAAAAEAAGLLGIPHAARLEHEYELASTNGIASNLNILRWLNQIPPCPARAYCSQDIHVRLHLAGFFPRLFAQKVEFGLISCHAGLGMRLAEIFSIRLTRQLIVPEEQGAASVDPEVIALTGLTGLALPHFPVIYQRHLAALAAPQQGRVWLIAAGVLGKIYAGAIAAAGGVALDIGSIADGWAGNITRPYLRQIGAFRL